MAKIKNDRRLTFERLKQVLVYDVCTGLFRWKETLSPKAVVGSIAGSIRKSGYRYIAIDGEQYRAARLVWFYVNGYFPEILIDHENRVKSDDRFVNLRLADCAENIWNTGLIKTNTSGFKGVCRTQYAWQASISVQGKRIHLGSFKSAVEAGSAYEKAAKKFHGEFASAV